MNISKFPTMNKNIPNTQTTKILITLNYVWEKILITQRTISKFS